MAFPKKNLFLAGIYNQQFRGTIILMVLDLQSRMHSCRKSTMAVLTTLRSTPSWTTRFSPRAARAIGAANQELRISLDFHGVLDVVQMILPSRARTSFSEPRCRKSRPFWPHISSDWPAVWPLTCPNWTHHSILWSCCALSRLSWMGIYVLLPLVRFCCEGFLPSVFCLLSQEPRFL